MKKTLHRATYLVLAVMIMTATPIFGGRFFDTVAYAVEDTTGPAVTLDDIAATVEGEKIVLSGTVDDNEVENVQVFIDGQLVADTPGVVEGRYSYEASGLSVGTHTVYVSATDTAGNTGQSEEKEAVVTSAPDTTAPRVTLNDILPSFVGEVAVVSGAIDDTSISQFTILVDGIPLQEQAIANEGSFQFTVSGLLAGNHIIAVRAVDGVGNVGTSDAKSAVVYSKTVSSGGDGEVPAPTADESNDPTLLASAQFFTAPLIATEDRAVLGVQDTNTSERPVNNPATNSAASDTNQAVEGSTDTKKSEGDFGWLGFAWYWWLLVLAAAGFVWWLIAAARRAPTE